MSFALPQHHGAARPGETKLWVFAALLALAFHLSLGLGAIWLMRGEEFEDETGAPAIEMAMDFAAPKTEETDLPPGPESDASAAAPELPLPQLPGLVARAASRMAGGRSTGI